MSQETYVYIQLGGQFVPAGLLTMAGQGRDSWAEFQYGRRYLERKDAIAVDPVSLPLQPGPFQTAKGFRMLFGGIRDASPDGWGRHVLSRAAESQGRALTEFDYLTLSADDRAGALAFGPDLSGPRRRFPFKVPGELNGEYLDLEEMLSISDTIENEDEFEDRHNRFLVRGSSFDSGLGGAQPKASTRLDGRLWVAKFSRKLDAWSTCRIEHATMTLAGLCGITVPLTRLIKAAGRDIFLIQRFDRDPSRRRKHFISARTLLGIQGEAQGEANSGDHTWSYQDIADQLRIHGSPSHIRADLEQLYRRMVFNVMCNNFDDHLRNHGLLHDGGWRLSPAYDIVARPQGLDDTPMSFLVVGSQGRTATIENLLSQPFSFGLDRDGALAIVSEIAMAIKNNWQTVFRSCRVPERLFRELEQISFANAVRFNPRHSV